MLDLFASGLSVLSLNKHMLPPIILYPLPSLSVLASVSDSAVSMDCLHEELTEFSLDVYQKL